MSDLASLFENAGCSNVSKYIHSGNVVFEAEEEVADQISATVSESILRKFGFEVPIVTRGAAEIMQVVNNNPFLPDSDDGILHVAFLADLPQPTCASSLDANRSLPDEFRLINREIYLRCPNGLARTKLTNAYFDSMLETTTTIRNWRTTLKLLAMSTEL